MFEWLLEMPALVKVLASLALVLTIKQFAKSLVVALLVGSAVLGLWAGHGAPQVADIAWRKVLSVDGVLLAIVVAIVIWLSDQMATTGLMNDLVTAVRARVSRRVAMAVLPAVIGLLPMPGGALFSAPMVDSCDPEGTVPPLLKSCINYWFRHLWEFGWPLYAGVLLITDYADLPLWQYMLVGIPLLISSGVAGYIFLLRHVPDHAEDAPENRPDYTGPSLFKLMMPIIVVVVVYTVILLGHKGLDALTVSEIREPSKYAPIAAGLAAAVLVLNWMRPLTWPQWHKILLSQRTMRLVALVMAALVYGAIMKAPVPGAPIVAETSKSMTLARIVAHDMNTWGIPVMLVMMALPLLAGITTGLSVGYVAASFPVIMALLGPLESLAVAQKLAIISLGLGCGYMGVILSPIHVCHIVTNEHFGTRLLHSTLHVLKPTLFVIAASVLLHLLIMAVWV
jgi:uncharacterized protein